ncbi:hypothetical protein MNBD_ALPHA06-2270 [hydrothermal vent metagenome]|uniref:DUF2125 domain-containing protein n=1 Tax=hydrothermal vent metagenome TaxID=652676 RepID=A0A3B0S0L8_9ZZZZ
MQNTKKTGKSRIWIPSVAAVLLVLAWSGYWMFGAGWLQNQTKQQIANLQAEGYQVSYNEMKVSGWPYRFALTMQGVTVIAPPDQQNLQIYTPVLRVHAMAWKLSHLIVEIPQDSRIRDAQDQNWLYSAQRSRASLVFRQGRIFRLSTELANPVLSNQNRDAIFTAERIEMHLRPGSELDSRNVFAFATMPVWPDMPLQDISELRLQAEVFSWASLAASKNLAIWRNAAGHLQIEEAVLASMDASATVSGDLSIDQNGFLNGTTKVQFVQPGRLFDKLDKTRLRQDNQKLLDGIMVLTGGVKQVSLSFKLKKGGVYAGPFRLARMSPIVPSAR